MTKTSVLSPEDEHDIDRAEWAAFVADGEALAGALQVELGSDVDVRVGFAKRP